MAQLKPDDIARRCLCIEGVPKDVRPNETRVYFTLTDVLDFHFTSSGKHIFLFEDEEAANLQLQRTPTVILNSPEGTLELSVKSCDACDVKTSWLKENKKIKAPMETVYVNTAAAAQSFCQVPMQCANDEQTNKISMEDNPNQAQQPTDTSVKHPSPGTGPYGPGWEHYPHPSQCYPGQFIPQHSESDQSINSNQDGSQKNPVQANPPQPPPGYWYANMPHPGFPAHFPSGIGNPPPGDGSDQMLPPHYWNSMPPGAQMPNTSGAAQGIGNPYQQFPYWYPNYGPFGPPPPYEKNQEIKSEASSRDDRILTEEKSTASDVTSKQSYTEVKSPAVTADPLLRANKPTGDLISMVQDEFLEKIARKKQQEEQKAGETSTRKEPTVKQEEEDEPVRKLKITKLPEGTTEDTLLNFFENRRRNGGGPIERIEYHPATSSAIIEFQEADVVDRVLKKRPLLFLKKQISVEEYVEEVEEEDEEEEEPAIRTVEVHGFAENAVEEVLEMYFENSKRSGGGEVTSCEIEDGVALVTFADAEVASSVCEREHLLDGYKLKVTLHLPKQKSFAVETGREEEEEAEEPVCTVEVRGYKVGTESTVELYFENKKRSGGDEIVKFDPVDSDGVIFITFASEEVARRVAQREHAVSGCTLDVKLYEPPKRKSAKHLTHICSNEPEESVPHCTVEVKGVTKTLNQTTLKLYFENKKRSGGDEFVNFDYKEENEIAYITYESEEVAQRVVSHGQHKVEGQPLAVKLYIPPPPRPTYTNRVLLSGLTSKVTRDGLTNFLEAKIGLTPDNFLYGVEGDKVIITFDEIIDFQKLEEACKKRALEGNHLQPSKVPVSNCILVLNLKIETTDDTIELYFENEKRSWGGPVEKVEFRRDEEYCLVFFEDHIICDRVLQRKHKIDGSDIHISMYYECLGRTSEDDTIPCFKPPKPVKLEGLDFAKMQFLKKSEPNRTALEKQLQDCFTQIQWPQTESDCTILTCTLTSDVPDCKKKALTWAKQAEQNLHDFLKVISIHEHKVFKEIFETVLQNLQNLTIANPDGVALFVKNAEFCIQVVGHKAVVTVVVKDIDETIKKAESDFDRKKKQTKESLTNLKHHQLKLLLAQKYPSQMDQQYMGLKVKINLNKNEIVFEGLMEDIRTAQVAMYEAVHNAAVSQLKNLPEGRLFLYKSKEVKDYIVAKLKSKKLVGVWDVEGSGLNIYANSDEAVVESTHIINESVKEHQKDLEPPQRSVVQSQQWKDKMKDLEKQYQGKLNVVLSQDCSRLCLYFTDDILGIIMEEVTDFLSRNTVLEKLVTCSSGIVQLIERKNKTVLDKISKDLAHYYVQINSQPKGGFLIRGNQDGISQAAYKLQELIDSVKHREHELQKPGIAGYMEGKGREHINVVENQIPCVIQQREKKQYGLGENKEETGDFGQIRGSHPVTQAECRSYGLEKIFTVLGDITEIDADVLVNAADPKLEHRGGLAKAIVDKGGRIIREECAQFIEANGHLTEGQIHVTSGGDLRAKIIIHVVSPVWKGGNSNEDETLREIIFQCMETTAKNGFKSIAIPALGAGTFGCPVKQSTKVIAEGVRDFFREDQDSSIKEVYLSDIRDVTVKCFTEALGISYGKQCVKEVKQRPTQSQRSMRASWSTGASSEMSSIISGESSGFGNITIKVVKGEMDSQKVDVIVNTAAKSLDLTHGAVSQSLLRKAGQILQDECKMSYPNGIKDGEIAVTGGGNLSCQIVCHVALVQWNDPAASKKMLHGLMKKCLDQCEKDGYTSIAFPALGTGNLNYPKDVVAKEMFQHISTYSKDNPSSSVTDVRFVVYQRDLPTVQAFESEQQKWNSSGTRAGTRASRHIQPEESLAQEPDGFQRRAAAMNTDDSSRFADGFTFGKINVKIYQGDITQEDTDCIVNSSNEDLDLSRGGVSIAIMKKGGSSLAAECRKRADDMKRNGIAVTKGYGLNSKHLIHVVAVESNKWAPIINKCLLKAEELKARSIAFPALGTGVGVPPAEIASVMFKAITDFGASGAKSVTEVRIVIFQDQMVQLFVDAARNQGSGAKPKTFLGKIYSSLTGGNLEQEPRKVPLKSPQPMRPVEQTSTVWIDVYAYEKQHLDEAINKLDHLIKNDFNKTDFTESVIKNFSPDQVSRLQRLAQQWEIQITVDPKIGRITIEGVADGIMKVSDGIHRLIREADKKEQDKRSAELLKRIVQWHYIEITTESSELREYPADVNLLIENAYKDQKPFVTFFTNDGEEFKIDFNKMEEFSIKDPNDTVTVVRKDLIQEMAVFEAPSTWTKMAQNENLKVVNLQNTDQEYQDVQQKFHASVGGNRPIIKLERIQNRTLYQQYEAKKKLIEQNNRGHPNESSLWHGTSVDSVDSISMHGFNRSYCGKNATAFGDGVYFAKHANYSASDTYSRPDPSGNKKMYLCRVLTGQYTTGRQGMRVAPAKSGSNANDLYDSVVDNTSNPSIFVIFSDTQAIPEYLITFR
ncbi:hypothetical protein ACJMK2_006335 [Sinanodonta woodiana]|uniref:Poly [ADP-ribose] polymerase n=1 Tax=Sinanodonta woodiana TaxID=1069815 RepID=A0ABD3VVY3_SINWO